MSNPKRGFRAIGLCFLVALGMTALFAASAQAKGTWLVNGATSTAKISIESEPEGHYVLLVPGTNIEILCSTLAVTNAHILGEGINLGSLKFTGCATYQLSPLVALAECNPLEPIEANVHSLLVKHGGNSYVKFSPANLASLEFVALGFHCGALPLSVPVTGHVIVEDPTVVGGILGEAVKHLIKEAPTGTGLLFSRPKHGLKFGLNNATLDGSVWLKLANGLPWSGHGITVAEL